jgi:hypothetical protein
MPVTYPRATTEAVESLKLALFGREAAHEKRSTKTPTTSCHMMMNES